MRTPARQDTPSTFRSLFVALLVMTDVQSMVQYNGVRMVSREFQL
jgi:hypothetical protein